MRRLYRGLIICLISSAISSTLVYAGEYHNPRERTFAKTTDTLACAQCHTMHGSQGAGATAGSLIYSGAAAIYPMLLRQANVLELCLFCHSNNQAAGQIEGGRTPPDIWSGAGTGRVVGVSGETVNSAGLLCAGGSAIATPPCDYNSDANKISHTIDVNANVTPPGWTGAEVPLFTPAKGGFVCINCHDQHGNTNYRNLRNKDYRGVTFTGVNVSYNMGTDAANPTCSDGSAAPCFVQNIEAGAPPVGLAKYITNNVKFRRSPTESTNQGIQAFCKRCHNNFHFAGGENPTEMGGSTLLLGDDNTGNPWKRHPMMGVSITQAGINLHADATYWDPTLTWFPRVIDPNGTPGSDDEIPFCFSCHRVHGSTNHSNLIFGDPNFSVGGGGTMMRETCLQCHNQ